MASPLRIGHISDLHLRQHLAGTSAVAARRSRDMAALFTEALQAMRAAAVSVVVVTGDLIDHPDEPQDTPEILRNGAQDLRLVGQALAGLACPWIVLPGNHDHAELFQHEFGVHSRELDVHGVRLLAFHDWDRPMLTPAAEEEQIPQNVPRRVGAERRRFESILADPDPRPQVHLQHYVIAPRCDEGWPHTYLDGEMLRDALVADGRARLSLSGHFHPGVDSFSRGEVGSGTATWFCVAPAFCQTPHSFLLHDLALDGSLVTTRVDLRPTMERSL